jgi:outer membrane protein TolC
MPKPWRQACLLMCVLCIGCLVVAQTVSPGPGTSVPVAGSAGPFSVPTLDNSQNPYLGATPVGQPTSEVIDLSLADALDHALQYNLGLLLSEQGSARVRAARARALSDLLPQVNAHITEAAQQTNLLALGTPPAFFNGVSPIVGPFYVLDARPTVTQELSLKSLRTFRAAQDNFASSQFDVRNARDLVVLFVGGGYIQALADQSRVAAIQAQLTTAQSLYQQAVDMKAAGVIAAIDVLRSQVEMQVQQQRLVAAKNEFEKAKLALARAIGLPVSQAFRLSTEAPYRPNPAITLEEALERAFCSRPDYMSLLALQKAAEQSRRSATAEQLPSIQLSADYGILGLNLSPSHGTFSTAASLQIPIFPGGKIGADIAAAEAVLKQRQAQAQDMHARVEYEVRASFLDLTSATEQVEVARSSVQLAADTLQQARDRFAAGVTNNIEVIQAQESRALADENYIDSLLAHNLAKLSLARSLGGAEVAVKQYLGGGTP